MCRVCMICECAASSERILAFTFWSAVSCAKTRQERTSAASNLLMETEYATGAGGGQWRALKWIPLKSVGWVVRLLALLATDFQLVSLLQQGQDLSILRGR